MNEVSINTNSLPTRSLQHKVKSRPAMLTNAPNMPTAVLFMSKRFFKYYASYKPGSWKNVNYAMGCVRKDVVFDSSAVLAAGINMF